MSREVLKNNDHSFSSRIINTAARALYYQGTSLIWSPNGPHWRLLRKIYNAEIFSPKRLDALQHLRREEVCKTIDCILEDCKQGNSVKIGERAFMMSLSLVGQMVCGKQLLEPGSAQAAEFKGVGVSSKTKILAQRFDNMYNRLIEERLAQRADMQCRGNDVKDFLDAMLDLREDGTQLSLENIKATLMDMFTAGTDTISGTIEWTMAELLRNRTVMRKVQAELDDVVGMERRIEEADIANLPYLRAVVKEVLRLHPAAPLIFRRADMSREISGFLVPEKTQVIVNVWGLGRDPAAWKDPLNFNPDRFLEYNIDYKGQDFEFIPFGAGRRICIGLPLAQRMVHLVVGSLVQTFNWSIPIDNQAGIDMSETFGLTLLKTVPLRAIPIVRY
ncbi:hypothetical protein SUGI_0349350 [Cryptomeria japonica]|nr:hypothetical protein SUGI_0349350 [Cryptomeria japonica]